MLKYTDTEVTFREIPDEVTLCINISGCPIHCPECHSKELWEDIGTDLTTDELSKLIDKNPGITCVAFMGGDNDVISVIELGYFILEKYKDLKTAWYSGRERIYNAFDYVKTGPYNSKYGSLDMPTTNQRLYKASFLDNGDGWYRYWEDITYKFWNNK